MYFFIFIIFFILVCILGFNGRMINQEEKFMGDTCLNHASKNSYKHCNGSNTISCKECP